MNNDKESFIIFTERDGFDKNQKLESKLYLSTDGRYSLLELCCYHGAVDCFKLLRTKFGSNITQQCLELSFLGGNPEIMSECLKYQKPNEKCMEYAIISHNIDFVTFLKNEYDIMIYLEYCENYNNLEAFLVYFDQTNNFGQCFVYSPMFNIPSLIEYFLSHGANINKTNNYRETALHIAAQQNNKGTAEVLISHGANIDEKNKDGETALHIAARQNCKETAEVLISHGANIDKKNKDGETALYIAARQNCKETAEVLISHGANIDEKNKDGETALHIAAQQNNKGTAEVLISHGANIDKKIKMEKQHFILQHGKIVKKLLKFSFHMVQISMKKIKMEKQHFILQHGIILKKLPKFSFHMVRI
ncbi:hypothetical protein TVAG_009530 [Trichomonas vaginalis G3]|uniref:DUF3447 domain-containing protein n=1 Tax=Trichomonas vaginalis (strain ATCC PRA-98 / G3) TaxID=412133 RepID=A2G157_TRIV3|nr:spectrin binding [Trichomonas vaginalis G3]EAX89119.1 hypothetical protein TVAG_009530 [Trichomonas vaginalis G3]KAI5536235.1 spectrin binding [Trichomonas vaginalis G3]|eukprot:XP_001302049.1 hypothetical protein [Trichomonas vaginalis G3]